MATPAPALDSAPAALVASVKPTSSGTATAAATSDTTAPAVPTASTPAPAASAASDHKAVKAVSGSEELVGKAELDQVSQMAVWSETGEQTSLADVITPKSDVEKVLTVFIRHFHCGLCKDYCRALARKISPEDLKAAKVSLVIIGCGDWGYAKNYKKEQNLAFPIYSDPSRRIYETLGMTHRNLNRGPKSYESTSTMSSIFGALKTIRKVGLKNAGDIKQNGGEFLWTSSGNVFAHRMKNTNDHLPVDELMQAAGISSASRVATQTSAPAATTTAPPASTSTPTPTTAAAPVTQPTSAPTTTAAPTTKPTGAPTLTTQPAAAPSSAAVPSTTAAAPQPSEPKLTPAAPAPTA